MDVTLKNAYAEVYQILNILGEKYKKKIPQKLIKLFEEQRNSEYETNIKKDSKIEDIEISRNALIIISILNLKYWASAEEKERLQKIYDQNEYEYQEMINRYRQDDWLVRKKDKNDNYIETSLISEEKISIIAKIKRFFRKLIHKRK